MLPFYWAQDYDNSYPMHLQAIFHVYCVFRHVAQNGGVILDETLKRILSLIPHKPDGKFVHGAVKKFTTELGLKTGNIVSDWIAGRSKSYEGYLYQISALHNVSVEWLRGETDDPTPAGQKEKPAPVSESRPVYPPEYDLLSPEDRTLVDNMIRSLAKKKSFD